MTRLGQHRGERPPPGYQRSLLRDTSSRRHLPPGRPLLLDTDDLCGSQEVLTGCPAEVSFFNVNIFTVLNTSCL